MRFTDTQGRGDLGDGVIQLAEFDNLGVGEGVGFTAFVSAFFQRLRLVGFLF